jgi:hypothetical protein
MPSKQFSYDESQFLSVENATESQNVCPSTLWKRLKHLNYLNCIYSVGSGFWSAETRNQKVHDFMEREEGRRKLKSQVLYVNLIFSPLMRIIWGEYPLAVHLPPHFMYSVLIFES